MDSSTPPLFRLVDESTGEPYFFAHQIDGFFVTEGAPPGDVLLRKAIGSSVHIGQVLEESELQVLDRQGQPIGSYYIGWVRILSAPDGGDAPTYGDWILTFRGFSVPFPAAAAIWHRWASGTPIRSGEWLEYPTEDHESWLHVIQNAWSEKGRSTVRYGTGAECVLDGRRIVGEASLFCEAGEAMNGPGGYFGSSLTGFEDCLRSSAPESRPSCLVWKHSASSLQFLDDGFSDILTEILRDNDVKLRLHWGVLTRSFTGLRRDYPVSQSVTRRFKDRVRVLTREGGRVSADRVAQVTGSDGALFTVFGELDDAFAADLYDTRMEIDAVPSLSATSSCWAEGSSEAAFVGGVRTIAPGRAAPIWALDGDGLLWTVDPLDADELQLSLRARAAANRALRRGAA